MSVLISKNHDTYTSYKTPLGSADNF
jgi:hypothetical protein